MIAAAVLEYMFITVTCCEKVAKKLFEHRIEVCGLRIFWRLHPHHCQANSRTFQGLALRFPRLSSTKLIFQDFPGSGHFTNTIPGLSRKRGNPVLNYLWAACFACTQPKPAKCTWTMVAINVLCVSTAFAYALLMFSVLLSSEAACGVLFVHRYR